MRRFRHLLVVTLAAAAAGCVYGGRGVVREDRPVEAPPPPPPYDTTVPDSSYQSYQADVPPPPRAGADVSSEAIFYDQLSPYGYWTFIGPYGRVWVPSVAYGWRPYYYGQWVLTDWGWTFVSDDPWGWAAYHYGRWNWGVGIGWYWIPGRVWGPAWVSWRYGAGYVTWCPLGPPGIVFGYRHPAWVAVSERHFTRPIASVAVPAQRTSGVVTQARPLAGPHATVGRTGTFGPPVAQVARATGQQIKPVAAPQVVHPKPPAAASPGQVGVMRSPVQPRARATSPGRPGTTVRPTPQGPRMAPPGRSGGVSPRTGVAAPPSGSSGPRAAPPSSGGSSAPRAAPPSGGGGGGGGPRATPPSGGGGGGGGPHARPPSGGGGGPHAGGGGRR